MREPKKTLLSLQINNETDVLLARRRARQIANLLGFDELHQLRLALALSEVVKYFLEYSTGGNLDFNVEDAAQPMVLRLVVTGKLDPGGDTTPKPVQLHALLTSDCQLDQIQNSDSDKEITLRLGKPLYSRSIPFTIQELSELTNTLDKLGSASPLEEISQQNEELLTNLERIKKQQLALDELQNNIDQKVFERTEQLLKANAELALARDEAVKANDLKSQFIANISHEIRTPMSGILGLTEELIEISDSEDVQDLATYVLNSAKDLMRTVNDLLDFSKIETAKLSIKENPFNIRELCDRILQSPLPAARAKQIKVTEHLDPRLQASLMGDSDRIGQILLNLVNNAIKFTEEGCVDVRIALQTIVDGKYYVQFAVQDTGIGISQENIERLFMPYVQAQSDTEQDYGGTGLGLAICKSLVKQMGGVISCDSDPGVGSCFCFTLPFKLA
ncbi:MAG: hypothetical protein IPJ49_12065 [Candidatus Obscuribacter sp.]|nr:hypothetical protein [Candidatus Obscuribacter sp.]